MIQGEYNDQAFRGYVDLYRLIGIYRKKARSFCGYRFSVQFYLDTLYIMITEVKSIESWSKSIYRSLKFLFEVELLHTYIIKHCLKI